MVNSIVASLALFSASVAASSVGCAKVVNKCSYDVTLCNTPSADGGYEQQDKTLAPGETWDQTWTSLTNGNGWSIKLSKTEVLENILQYEYTFHNDGIIWYDLSCVNGNPWDQDWQITATGADCNPKQQAYRFATDDAYGMQSCPSEAEITVTLCTGVSADNGNSTNAGYAAAAPSYLSSASSASAPSYPSSSSSSVSAPSYQSASSQLPPVYSVPAITPTTLSTATTAVITKAPVGVTVTEVVTVYATSVVTAWADRRRHEHDHNHGRHAHHHDA